MKIVQFLVPIPWLLGCSLGLVKSLDRLTRLEEFSALVGPGQGQREGQVQGLGLGLGLCPGLVLGQNFGPPLSLGASVGLGLGQSFKSRIRSRSSLLFVTIFLLGQNLCFKLGSGNSSENSLEIDPGPDLKQGTR